ncbi:hypothetical protein M8494_20040 [Serratia ureilytica]
MLYGDRGDQQRLGARHGHRPDRRLQPAGGFNMNWRDHAVHHHRPAGGDDAGVRRGHRSSQPQAAAAVSQTVAPTAAEPGGRPAQRPVQPCAISAYAMARRHLLRLYYMIVTWLPSFLQQERGFEEVAIGFLLPPWWRSPRCRARCSSAACPTVSATRCS